MHRDIREIALERPMIGVAIQASSAEVAAFLAHMGESPSDMSLVYIRTPNMSVAPVLRSLQVSQERTEDRENMEGTLLMNS